MIWINLLKTLYGRNKLFFVVAVVALALVLVGCSASGSAPPSGPVGGGC